MQRRTLGRTGLELSVLGFGCGAVGGLMTRGDAADQARAVARAIELGINYFDTAPQYGDGESERNLGRILNSLKPDVIVGTKVRLKPDERGGIADAVVQSLEASLRRLGREQVDLLQLHNRISPVDHPDTLDAAIVLDQVVPALERLREQGKTRFFGITALGDTPALKRVIDSAKLDTAQIAYNLLNPSAAAALPPGFPGQDYGTLFDHTRSAAMGAIGIRVLAGGALSGSEARHPLGMQRVEPIGSAADYRTDVAHGRRFASLVQDGHAGSVTEAALRFAIAEPRLTTVLIGLSTLDELEQAAAAVLKGPLSSAALEQVAALQQGLAPARH